MLRGTFTHALDPKGRIIIPSRLREELGESFVLAKGVEHCISLYPPEAWENFTEQLEHLPKISSEPARRLRRFFYGNSMDAEIDKQGRLLIPQSLRNYAELKKDVTLVGVEDHVEVWDTDLWNDYNRKTEEDVDTLLYGLEGVEI